MELEKTITLRKAVEFAGVKYERLDLREPTAGELEKASSGATQIGVVINLIMLVAKIPRGAVEQLGQRDLKEAAGFLESFSEEDPATGETSSQS